MPILANEGCTFTKKLEVLPHLKMRSKQIKHRKQSFLSSHPSSVYMYSLGMAATSNILLAEFVKAGCFGIYCRCKLTRLKNCGYFADLLITIKPSLVLAIYNNNKKVYP